MSGAVAFAFAAGLLATVNPCGFAMLPSYLTLYVGGSEHGDDPFISRAARGFIAGIVLSASFGAVFVFSGLAVAAGLRLIIDVVPWVAVAIGFGLVVLGTALLAGRTVGLLGSRHLQSRESDSEGGYRRVAAFGVAYAFASLSCTLAVFLVVVGQALAVANPLQQIVVFGAYAAGSASLLIALSVSAALAKGALAKGLRRFLPVVNRVAGALLVVSGIYLILYWLPALGGDPSGADSQAARASREVSTSLASFFSDHTGTFAIGLGVLIVVGVALLVASTRRRRSGDATR